MVLGLGAAACTPGASGPQPGAPTAAIELPLRLVGTEPFWGGRIGADGITLSGADRPERRFGTPPVQSRPDGLVYEAPEVRIALTPGACSDGMSDRRYPYAAQVRLGGEVLRGCAGPERLFQPQP